MMFWVGFVIGMVAGIVLMLLLWLFCYGLACARIYGRKSIWR